MPRKPKSENAKVTRKAIAMHQSFFNWLTAKGRTSKAIQNLIAEDILEMDYSAFKNTFYQSSDAYLDREHVDPVEQEFIRAARWMIESEIVSGIYYHPKTDYISFDVRWFKTDTVTEVVIDPLREGFRRVIYDGLAPEGQDKEYLLGRGDDELTGVEEFIEFVDQNTLKGPSDYTATCPIYFPTPELFEEYYCEIAHPNAVNAKTDLLVRWLEVQAGGVE